MRFFIILSFNPVTNYTLHKTIKINKNRETSKYIVKQLYIISRELQEKVRLDYYIIIILCDIQVAYAVSTKCVFIQHTLLYDGL